MKLTGVSKKLVALQTLDHPVPARCIGKCSMHQNNCRFRSAGLCICLVRAGGLCERASGQQDAQCSDGARACNSPHWPKLREAIDEVKRRVSDFTPATVDHERVAAVRDCGD